MLIISPYSLRVITGLWETASNNVASDEQSEGDGLKYPYKDKEHAEKKYFIEPFFFFCFAYLFTLVTRPLPVLYLHSAKNTLAVNEHTSNTLMEVKATQSLHTAYLLSN